MFGPEDGAFEVEGSEFDPDAGVWVRGVDYVGGWRDAKDAAAELSEALGGAGVDVQDATVVAQTRADGLGVVRLVWSAATVRAVARLVRDAADLREAG
ncbi:hypothetical protein LKL35_10035 [Streptomyces sp. ET3-23]|uniref:hypothetical protein n=1 Tax=Streptomyces sp. ET3-23 TaxID=2885643 RepID=UPI001D12D12D|nr:hypothetical protein [Streptomyces sp. ET3-23]MCC2275755.1 hypothetical protein [Streptomyces sp. ET3-23]